MVRVATFLLALTLTVSAQAQVEEIPPDAMPAPPPPGATPAPPPPSGAYHGAPPPAAPAPPPVRLTRYSRYRTSWYIGFALGGGGGWTTADGGLESDTEGGVSLTLLRVGWVARPWMLLGFEASAWRHDGDPFWVQYNHYDLMATFFPVHDNGFLLKGGLGVGIAVVGDRETSIGSVDGRTDAGLDLRLGVGYEWQLLSAFNLGVEGAYSLTAHEEGRTHDVTVQLTFTWY
jgi:hypothetical protein